MGYYQGMTVLELQEAVAWELGQITGTTVIYTTFSEAQIRIRLYHRLLDFAAKTHCTKTRMALIEAVADQRTYRLPQDCIDGGVVSAKFYGTSTSYTDLDIYDREYMDEAEEGYEVSDSSTPEYAFPGRPYGQLQTLEVYPAPDTAATAYAQGDDTGISVGTTYPLSSDNIAGTATGGGATTCVDSGDPNFDESVVAGQYILNVTDKSYARVSSLATTTVTHATLVGGTANVFAASDEYLVLCGEFGTIVFPDDNDQFLFCYKMGGLDQITVPANTFKVDYIPYPIEFSSADNDDHYPEAPKQYHRALAMGAVADILGMYHEKSKEFQRSQWYEGLYQKAVMEASVKKESRPFNRKPVRMRPGR